MGCSAERWQLPVCSSAELKCWGVAVAEGRCRETGGKERAGETVKLVVVRGAGRQGRGRKGRKQAAAEL